MNKVGIKPDALKKIAARLVRHAPASPTGNIAPDPLQRLVEACMEYDTEPARGQAAAAKLIGAMVDYNDLRVTSVMEMVALIGSRYPFADSRCAALRRTLQSIYDREHQLSLECLRHMKKAEIRKYLQTLYGINAYVEAIVALDSFDVHAVPVDTKLLLWMISKDAASPETTVLDLQQALERSLRGDEMADFHHGARKELELFTPRVWPAPVKLVPQPSATIAQAAPAVVAGAAPAASARKVSEPPRPTSQKHADKHAEKHVEKHPEKHADKHIEKHVEKHAEKHADKHAPKHPEKHGDKHVDKHPEKHADKHVEKHHSEKHKDVGKARAKK